MSNLRPFYTIMEIAQLTGKKYDSARRMMHKLNIKSSKIGKLVVFYLSDIKEAAPSFYESFKEVICFDDHVILEETFASSSNSLDLTPISIEVG